MTQLVEQSEPQKVNLIELHVSLKVKAWVKSIYKITVWPCVITIRRPKENSEKILRFFKQKPPVYFNYYVMFTPVQDE